MNATRGSRYRFDGHGDVLDVRMVPPTAQNQKGLESAWAALVADRLDLTDDTLHGSATTRSATTTRAFPVRGTAP